MLCDVCERNTKGGRCTRFDCAEGAFAEDRTPEDEAYNAESRGFGPVRIADPYDPLQLEPVDDATAELIALIRQQAADNDNAADDAAEECA